MSAEQIKRTLIVPNKCVGMVISYKDRPSGIISKVEVAVGYPEHFETYYQVFVLDANGQDKWYINLPESEFYHGNPMFQLSNS